MILAMTEQRRAGLALIASSAALLVTMAFHPLPAERLSAEPRGVAVHVLAIVFSPVSLYGARVLSRRLRAPLAFQFQLFALVVGMFAPIMSGLVGPSLTSPETLRFAGALNQACTRIWVAGTSIAIVLWGLASWRERLLPRPLTIYGFACALAVLAIVAAGVPFDVHHTGLVALLEAIYFITAGVTLLRSRATAAPPVPSPA